MSWEEIIWADVACWCAIYKDENEIDYLTLPLLTLYYWDEREEGSKRDRVVEKGITPKNWRDIAELSVVSYIVSARRCWLMRSMSVSTAIKKIGAKQQSRSWRRLFLVIFALLFASLFLCDGNPFAVCILRYCSVHTYKQSSILQWIITCEILSAGFLLCLVKMERLAYFTPISVCVVRRQRWGGGSGVEKEGMDD